MVTLRYGRALFLGAVLFGVSSTAADEHGPVRIGDPMPDVTLRKASGGTLRLSSLHGQVVTVTFFSAYCEPCRKELPALMRAIERIKSENAGAQLRLLVVAIDELPSTKLTSRLGGSAEFLLDESGEAQAAFAPGIVPCTYLANVHGTVRHINRGYGSGYQQRITRWLRALVQEG
jgi:peroxiredoxin